MGLAGQQVRLLGVRREQQVGAPLGDRDDRAAGLQCDAGGARLAGHRPQVGVAGEGALRVERDALAAPHGVDRRPEGAERVGALAVHRNLPGPPHHGPHESLLEKAVLGEESRNATRVVLKVGVPERVHMRIVVHHGDKTAVGRNVLHSAPVALQQK
jgi:hypothetical protein